KRYLFCAILPSVFSAIFLAQLLGSDPFSRMFEKLSNVGCDSLSDVIGVPVAGVTDTGPAKDAQLQKRDVIVKVDGKDIQTEGDLEYYLGKKKFSDEVLLGVQREERSATVDVKLVLPSQPAVGRDKGKPRENPGFEDLGVVAGKEAALEPRFSGPWFLLGGCLVGAIVYTLSLLLAWVSSFRRGKLSIPVFLAWVMSGSIYGVMLGFAFYAFVIFPGGTLGNTMFIDSPALPLTFGVPWILLSQFLAQVVFVGLSSRRSGSDWDREWQG